VTPAHLNSADLTSASGARLPAVLAGYRCGRSLACCQLPWKATLQPGELPALLAGPMPAAQLLRGALSRRPGTPLLSQPGGVCSLLDPQAQACRLQQSGGLTALPLACRNFPRSVVETPQGREVAFLLACPTAAALVVAQPQPFAWQSLQDPQDLDNYPAYRRVADRVAASRAADWTLAELERWREGWWQRLGDPDQELLQILSDAQRTPLDPWTKSPIDPASVLPQPWTQPQVQAVTEALSRLRDSGELHRSQVRNLWQRWLQPADPQAIREAAQQHRQLASCCAGLWLQHAAVHDGRPLGEAMGIVAHQTGQLLRLIGEFQVGPPNALALRDAVVAASHWAR
jgi:hypothetical protein